MGLNARDADICTRQLGQLFLMGFDGTTANGQVKSLIEDYHVGSILLSAKNLKCTFNTDGHFYNLAY
jgi:beta-N-acetylhexosaminidase